MSETQPLEIERRVCAAIVATGHDAALRTGVGDPPSRTIVEVVDPDGGRAGATGEALRNMLDGGLCPDEIAALLVAAERHHPRQVR